MSSEIKKQIGLQIAHVLFLDIVGYSKRLVDEQRALVDELNGVVRQTDEYREAESAGQLIKIPTGDGMALVFYSNPEAPVECALEICRALKEHPKLAVRMGVHSGPVSGVVDVNERANVAGAGINFAQRVMDCGDGGHILLSKHVAEDLEHYSHWRPYLHELGDCEVKHGVRVAIVNVYTEELGNPAVPEKLKLARAAAAKGRKRTVRRWASVGMLALLAAAAAISFILVRNKGGSLTAGAAAVGKSIAVLPFENLSRDPDNAFFADGVQDEILTDLARIADLKVISRTSVMPYKSGVARNLREIGRQLGVAHVLEGSVQRAANRVRVNAQLIDARTDAHLWAQVYDRDLGDVFAIQSEIAKIIAEQLQAKISSSEKDVIEHPPTKDITAFDLYSHAKTLSLSFFGDVRGKNLQAVDLLNQALARDPSFFLAQCQLAHAHDKLYFFGIDHTATRLAAAKAAAEAALQLRPDAGEAHLARAENLYQGYLNYDGALAELKIARRTLPNDPRVSELTAYIQNRQGKTEEALRNLQRAVELDPRNVLLLQQLSLSDLYLRRYSDAAAVLDSALAIEPDNSDVKIDRAFIDFHWKADTQRLHQTLDSAREKNPVASSIFLCALAERDATAANEALRQLGDRTWGVDAMRFSRSFGEALIARMKNDETEADSAFFRARAEQEKVVQAGPDYGPAVCVLGLIDAGLGRKEEALREGRHAIELMSVTKDSTNGTHMIEFFAIIAAWVGEKDLACEQIAVALQHRTPLSYGQLKLFPWWDPVRGDPCFEKIVASLAPKEAAPK